MDRGPGWATVHGVAESRTQLRRLSVREPQRCSQEGRGALSRNWRTPVSACSAMLYVSGCRTCRLLGLVASAFAEPGMFFARHGG